MMTDFAVIFNFEFPCETRLLHFNFEKSQLNFIKEFLPKTPHFWRGVFGFKVCVANFHINCALSFHCERTLKI